MPATSPSSPGVFREQMLASIFSEVADATQQFRVDQEERLRCFELRIQQLMSSSQKTFDESFGDFSKGQTSHESTSDSMLIIPPEEWDSRLSLPQAAHVHAKSAWELELTRLQSPRLSLLVSDESHLRNRTTMNAGPSSQQLARMYGVPAKTANFFRDDNRFVSRRSQTRAARFLHDRRFPFAVGCVIMFNAMFIGACSNWTTVRTIDAFNTRQDDNSSAGVVNPPWAPIGEAFFTIVFAVEVLLRIFVEERAFFGGDEKGWNLLDVLLVTAGITELVTSVVSVRDFRLLRLVCLLRILRILRFSTFFSKLRLLSLALQNSVMPFFWSCSMVFWMLYLVSVVLLHGVTFYVGSGKADPAQVLQLQQYFGSLHRSTLTLFMCITGGMDWNTPFHALRHIHAAHCLVFILFVAFMLLAALNIIAGIFVNDAIEMAQKDRDVAVQAEAGKNKTLIGELSVLFREFDTDNTGTLNLEELTEAFQDPEVSARFRMLGVEETDAAALFRTLDVHGSEELDIKEFVTGCLRAKSLTKPVDFQTFIREVRRRDKAHEEHFKKCSLKLDWLQREVIAIGERAVLPRVEAGGFHG